MKILSPLLLLLLVSFVSAQYPLLDPQPEKAKKTEELNKKVLEMLDQVVADAQGLRLAQNRAIVYAVAGDLYWKFDEKRARELFKIGEGEIIAANAEFERENKSADDPFSRVFEVSTVRIETLPLVAKHDPQLALEMLLTTRPAKLADAMYRAGQPNTKVEDDPMSFTPERRAVRMEIDLEQRFAYLAADSDPDKAIALLKDSLARGVSWNVVPLLQKLYRKDEKKALDLAGEVVRKIVDADLTRRADDLNAAISLLSYAGRSAGPADAKEKQFRFSDAQVKDLANKLAATFLAPSKSTSLLMAMSRSMSMLQKVVPEKAALLKIRQAESLKNLPPEYRRAQQQQRLWDSNTTPEDILAQLPKLNEIEKASAYQALPGRIAQIDDEARAKKLIDQIPDEKARESAADQYESVKISRASRDGRLDDARRLIGNLGNRKTQVQRLVALAMDFQRRGGDQNLETASGMMKEARAMINEFPEDEDEFTNLLEVVRGYSLVDPNEAFRLFEPVIDQINEVVQASAILSKYDKRNRSFRSGELVLKANNSYADGVILFRCVTQMQMLGKADLERMSLLADRLQRTDARLIAKLYIAQGFLQEPAKTGAAEIGAGYVIFGN